MGAESLITGGLQQTGQMTQQMAQQEGATIQQMNKTTSEGAAPTGQVPGASGQDDPKKATGQAHAEQALAGK